MHSHFHSLLRRVVSQLWLRLRRASQQHLGCVCDPEPPTDQTTAGPTALLRPGRCAPRPSHLHHAPPDLSLNPYLCLSTLMCWAP